jgi:hypothetical protein
MLAVRLLEVDLLIFVQGIQSFGSWQAGYGSARTVNLEKGRATEVKAEF